MKHFPYNFGLSQEDALSEFKLLKLESKRILCVASGGEVPLNLLALGVKEVVAYDMHEGQIALCHLKLLAAQELDPWEAAKFIGYCHQSRHSRLKTYQVLRRKLPDHIREWWDDKTSIIANGALWQGKFERFLKWLSLVGGLIFNRKKLEKLFSFETLAERKIYFNQAIDNRRLHWLFRFAFNERRYGDKALPAVALRHNNLTLSEAFMHCFRSMCIATSPKKNYYLQLLLLGEIRFKEALPEYLNPHYREQFLNNRENIDFVQGDLTEEKSSGNPFDAIILSNICDWVDKETYQRVLIQMSKNLTDGGTLFWRSIYSKFSADECNISNFIPSKKSEIIPIEEEDRFPFYGFYYLRNNL